MKALTRIGAIAALLLALVAAPSGASAACSDPFSGNDPLVFRDLSGVELLWYFEVTPGCTVSVDVEARRDDATNPDDVRSVVHRRAGALTFTSAGGQHTQSVLITTTSHVRALLIADGRVYRAIDIEPLDL